MKGFIPVLALCAAVVGCKADKPSKQECERAIAHMRTVYGNQAGQAGADQSAMVRSCQALSSKKSVNCVLNATTPADLEKCESSLTGGKQKAPAAGETPETPGKEKAPAAGETPETPPGDGVQ